VLDHPEIPLHTTGSENDSRCQIIRRKISATTRRDNGRDYRDAVLGLTKTRRKLGVSFWDFLETRLRTLRCQSARGYALTKMCFKSLLYINFK
jgi:hypothetical protein